MNANKNVMEVKPERNYERVNLSFDEIKEGDIIPVLVTGYNWENGGLECMISPEIPSAIIHTEDFDFPTISKDFDMYNTPSTILYHINKTIVAKVVKKRYDGVVELDRRSVIQKTYERLVDNLGNTVIATIESMYDYGAFVDLGNGIHCLLHISDFSKCFYRNLKYLFRIGEPINVKLMNFNPITNKFTISRKEAYTRSILECGSIQTVRIFDSVDDGAFVEYDPATSGIMDIRADQYSGIKYGDYVSAYIKKNNDIGFKAFFISKI